MKKILLLICPLVVLLIASCKEEPPYINYEQTKVSYETTYVDLANLPASQLREVLIEDLSGVRCVNCPNAAYTLNALKLTYPGRVNSMTVYPKDILDQLTLPVNKPNEGFVSKYDMRTDAGKQMLTALGTPASLPTGYVDRKVFTGKTNRFVDMTEWSAKIVEEKDSITPVNIDMTTSIDADGKLNADLTLYFTKDLTGDYNVSLALIQDSIIDVQEYNDSVVGVSYNANYAHRHVLRAMLTSSLGDQINNSKITLVKGRVLKRRYSMELTLAPNSPPFPPYDKKHLAIVAFVQRAHDQVVVQSKTFEIPE